MRKIFAAFMIISSLTWTSCIKEKAAKPMSPAEVKHQVDSIVAKRAQQIEENAKRDLQLRLKIEVKAKADSLIKKHQQPADTTHPTPKI